MKNLPSISAEIDEKVINKVIQDNFAALAPYYFTLTSNWFVRAYDHYKDIDKFVIIIYLIHQDLIYFRQNGLKIDYETFYKNKSLEIDKIKISDISKDLGVPKESVRRKVLELENQVKKYLLSEIPFTQLKRLKLLQKLQQYYMNSIKF